MYMYKIRKSPHLVGLMCYSDTYPTSRLSDAPVHVVMGALRSAERAALRAHGAAVWLHEPTTGRPAG